MTWFQLRRSDSVSWVRWKWTLKRRWSSLFKYQGWRLAICPLSTWGCKLSSLSPLPGLRRITGDNNVILKYIWKHLSQVPNISRPFSSIVLGGTAGLRVLRLATPKLASQVLFKQQKITGIDNIKPIWYGNVWLRFIHTSDSGQYNNRPVFGSFRNENLGAHSSWFGRGARWSARKFSSIPLIISITSRLGDSELLGGQPWGIRQQADGQQRGG